MMRPMWAVVISVMILSGCRSGELPGAGSTQDPSPSATPTASMSPTASVSPTPSATLSGPQQEAMLAAEHHWSVLDKILRQGTYNGTAIIKALRPTATDAVIQSNLNAARKLWKAQRHLVGTKEILTRRAAGAQSRGTQVTITFCQQQDVALANKRGKVVARPYPDHLVISYDMRRIRGAFKVYEAESREVTKC